MKRSRPLTPARLFLRRFRKANRGVTAVEFSLLALPFFSLLLATFEATAMFFASVSLETGAADASRLVRTGQVQTQDLSRQDIRDTVCDAMFMGCDARMQIDVRRFDSFTNVNFSDPLTADGDLRTDLMFQPGGPGDIILVRVFYTWDIVTPVIGGVMSNMADGRRLLISSTAFRNEPFSSAAPGGS